ncbi:hypothetical protein [Paenibacillus hamazuiensis]|uniref:hypothetical protein n=1 Tax=Paenibacillus hamazuiensis TaxID=2936508 RepID=UPI00200EDB8E|nr:hypothetical protein [Paenibacillus hamazuiensis]
MSGTALATTWETGDAPGEYEPGIYGRREAGEHDECGGTAFFPLSPVHQTLYYFFIPEISCE